MAAYMFPIYYVLIQGANGLDFYLFYPASPHKEVYWDFQPLLDIFRRSGAAGLLRPQWIPFTPSVCCPIASSGSTQSQEPL